MGPHPVRVWEVRPRRRLREVASERDEEGVHRPCRYTAAQRALSQDSFGIRSVTVNGDEQTDQVSPGCGERQPVPVADQDMTILGEQEVVLSHVEVDRSLTSCQCGPVPLKVCEGLQMLSPLRGHQSQVGACLTACKTPPEGEVVVEVGSSVQVSKRRRRWCKRCCQPRQHVQNGA
jgi:hypothetical protein